MLCYILSHIYIYIYIYICAACVRARPSVPLSSQEGDRATLQTYSQTDDGLLLLSV